MDNQATCEFPVGNPPSDEVKNIILNSKTIAVVGLSDNETKDSYKVAKYMKDNGYKIYPVNPAKETILGEKCYPDLKSIPEKIDIVDIFRKPEFISEVVDQAIDIKAKCVWMQLGLAHNKSARKAEKAGMIAVQSKCLKVEHSRLV